VSATIEVEGLTDRRTRVGERMGEDLGPAGGACRSRRSAVISRWRSRRPAPTSRRSADRSRSTGHGPLDAESVSVRSGSRTARWRTRPSRPCPATSAMRRHRGPGPLRFREHERRGHSPGAVRVSAQFDITTFSGSIDNDIGPPPNARASTRRRRSSAQHRVRRPQRVDRVVLRVDQDQDQLRASSPIGPWGAAMPRPAL